MLFAQSLQMTKYLTLVPTKRERNVTHPLKYFNANIRFLWFSMYVQRKIGGTERPYHIPFRCLMEMRNSQKGKSCAREKVAW